MTTRRRFLTGCSVLATAAAFQPATLLSAASLRINALHELPGLTAFAGHLGSSFRVSSSAATSVRLRLVEARPLPLNDAAAIEHQFSLLFTGPGDLPLTQDTYTLDHAALGRMAMFLVPVMRQEGRHQCYEAIFNRYPGPLV
jgi:hypothetical protein